MLSEKEKAFIAWWQENRSKKRKGLRQYYFAMPLGAVVVIGTFLNFFSGWYKRADMQLKTEISPSLIITLFVAGILIIVFFAIFTVKHRWDVNEQYYRELLSKKDLS
jgi:protein-S-isoprenylcysteine O-methyltransferase Ste14